LRRWKQRPEFGPVTLLYADGPVSQVDSLPCGDLVLRCEPHPDNESALARVVRLRETMNLFMPLIVEDDGTVVWSGLELLHECDVRKECMRDPSATAPLGQPPK
jgi:hypothetical protein